ncbi:unconventional myosin-IXAb-like [Cyprinus carpio]|uniref:Unconventional myosin-IXAb-like n=1 Tax=Cyprinus carpio TaxID=7962 RepID=A0A9Q9ZS09_CYPCA|nr:unconventional myosin-IXAb-like [Cyprinus carpio]
MKSRSKRESRRQRELQHATFSLELLKVRSASVDETTLSRRPPPDSPDSCELKQVQEKRESVVVIISMQKESPVEHSSPEALHKPQPMDAQELAGETQDRADGLSSDPEPQTHRSLSSRPLQLDSRDSEPKKEVQKKCVSQSISISMKEKAFSPKRSRLTFSKSDKDLLNQERSLENQREPGFRAIQSREVSRAAGKKKARLAGTRSDFLSRACSTELDSEHDEEEEYEYRPVLSRSPPLPDSPSSPDSHSHAQTSSQKEQKRIQKTVSSGDLGKMDSLRKSISQTDGRVRGKMRFWSKSKHGNKKMSTRGRSADSDLRNGSPEQVGLSERGHDSKENREPMMGMMSMKRRRSVKISSVSLESSTCQNDSLHILTSTADYRSMNDFLMKKISDLEAEDSQKDTPVDVVFKKALKEFRLNIFNSYSTALAMDDGRSIRYKDLHALFEHILEKNMRLEQRDWSESPVKVWVNTFKVFLDEFMTEYKPMNGTISKAPKPERKKRRKKESDTVSPRFILRLDYSCVMGLCKS